MRENISINIRATISKMGLNVNILCEPLLLHYKQLKIEQFNFSMVDYNLFEYIMLTVEFDPETFRNYADIMGKILCSSSLISRNLIHLMSVLIASHSDKPQFVDSLLRLFKILIKDLLTFERSLKEKKPLPKNSKNKQMEMNVPINADMESSLLKVKRTILFKVAKYITELEGDQLKRN
jgi:hypothetical protein